jgi:hypothetical protein
MQRTLRLALICLLALATAVQTVPALPGAAFAQSSGGYSRPRSSYIAPSRRPDLGSGGYGRPSVGGYTSPYSGYSGGDRAMSRQSSAEALQRYRSQLDATRRPPVAPAPSTSGTYGSANPWSGYADRRPSAAPAGQYGGWGNAWGGGAPPAYVQPGQRFGAWDAVMLWALLNTLTASSSRNFFYDNRNDPGYLAWRAQADQVAQQNPQVQAKLAQLDRDLAQKQAQPATTPASGGGLSVWLVLFLMVAAFVLLWVWRRRRGQTGSAPPGLSGSAETRFRVGMTMPFDPAPFLLAANTTKVKPPAESGMMSVEAVGVVSDGAVRLHRLYFPGEAGFLQLHLGADGKPDECRYFSRLDEVEPASNQEWGVWLDPAEGLIGWPEFQTKDGKIYGRVWAPGPARVPPRALDETRQDLRGTTTRRMQAMLYGAPTGAAPPAPQTEYVLVAAVEESGQAWVELDAGIDINPASLTLPSVAL